LSSTGWIHGGMAASLDPGHHCANSGQLIWLLLLLLRQAIGSLGKQPRRVQTEGADP